MFNIVLCELSYYLFFFLIQDLYSYNKKLTKYILCNYKVISFSNTQAIAASNFKIQTYLFRNVYFLFNFESVTRTTSNYEFAPYYNLQDNSCELQAAKFLKFDNVSFTLRHFNYKWLNTSLAAFTKTFFGRTQLFLRRPS